MHEMLIIIASFLLIFGVILYLVTHKLVRIWQDDHVKKRKISLWVWRITLVIIPLFLLLIIFLNRNPLFMILSTQSSTAASILVFLFVLFISLIEITVIDLLLPDVVSMWKRIVIETLALLVLVITTVA